MMLRLLPRSETLSRDEWHDIASREMIIVNLDKVMARRKMSLTELSERVGITIANLSILKTGKARAVRLSTLDAICSVLKCTPGEILEFRDDYEPDSV